MVFQDLVRDKQVLIVGNSTSIRGQGALIDSYEFVIRLNYAISQNKKFNIGTKCSAWVYAMSSENLALTTFTRANIKPEYCVRFASPARKQIGNFIDLSSERGKVYSHLMQELGLKKGQNPSTGVSLVYYLTLCAPKSISLIGFDSFKRPNFYANRVWAAQWHDTNAEAGYLENLAKSRIIQVL